MSILAARLARRVVTITLSEHRMENSATDLLARALLVIWVFLLIPWVVLAPLSGMAFDGGYTWKAYLFVGSLWTYPIVLAIAIIALHRGKGTLVLLLPLLNVAGTLVAGF